MDLESLWKCAIHIKMIRELITPDLKLSHKYVINIERSFTMDQAEAVVEVLNNELFYGKDGNQRILSIGIVTLGIIKAYRFRLIDASIFIIHKKVSYTKQPSSRDAAISMLASPDFIDLLNEYFPKDSHKKDNAVIVLGKTIGGELKTKSVSY